MKNFLLPTTTLLNLLLLLLTPTPPTATADYNPVLDVYGDPLEAGKQYYIEPYKFSDGGGLKPALKKNSPTCSTYYVRKLEENLDSGTSVSFINQIPPSYDLNIVFNGQPPRGQRICPRPTYVWKLTFDRPTGEFLVGLDGLKGNQHDVGSWFTIVEHEVDGYMIRYCPDRFGLEGVVCGNLGVVYDRFGGAWFGVNNTHPLAVMFEPAFGERLGSLVNNSILIKKPGI